MNHAELFAFFFDIFYGFAAPVVKCIALLLLGTVLIPFFLWCVTGNKNILLMVLLAAGILILPFIVIIMLLVLL